MADRRADISAAIDGEGPMPTDLDTTEARFLDAATRLRSMARLEEAEVPPDVTDAVLAAVASTPPASPPRSPASDASRTWLTAAAVFVVAALAAGLLARPGGPFAPEPAVADVGDRVLAAQHDVRSFDARVELIEHDPHPDVPERRYLGTLRYRSPEQVWLHLEQAGDVADFPANDLDLVIDGGSAWSEGLRACPVGDQPGCLGSPVVRATTGLAPFAADWLAPLDLVIPTGAFLPAADIEGTEHDGVIELETTVARVQRTIDGLRLAGALREVHPTDLVRLRLDADTATIRRLTVVASGSTARAAWAASHGYGERAGAELLELVVAPTTVVGEPPARPAGDAVDAGFVDGPVGGPTPSSLPDGYVASRSGRIDGGSTTVTTVQSWTDGRGWIRVDAATGRDGDQLLGLLGPVVQRLAVGTGVGYADPSGRVVSLHAGGLDVAVSGSATLEVLVAVAASLPLTGEPVPPDWPQGAVLDVLPTGTLRGDGPVVARYDGDDLVVVLPGPGGTGAVLRQRPASDLGPPSRIDAAEVAVRATTGRYDPRTSRLEWLEGGWRRELRADGLDLDQLVALAARLEPA